MLESGWIVLFAVAVLAFWLVAMARGLGDLRED
jgi:hypothetical protein